MKEHALKGIAAGGLRSNDQVHVTVEHLQQGEQLIDRLAVVRLIEKSIQLRRRCPESAHDLALREGVRCDSLLRLKGQSVQQEIAEVRRILVVLEHLLSRHQGRLVLPYSSGIIVCIKKTFHIDERLLGNAKTRVS